MIQEYRFNQYCERLQKYISQKLDEEFKLFLRWRGFSIESSLFDIKFNEPQNFAAYRQSELDKDRVATFQAMEAFPYISKRFALQRFLGLSEEEIKDNERMWEEEREEPEETEAKGSDLRSIGISASDVDADEEQAAETEENPEGMPPDVAPGVAGPQAMPPGGAGAPAGMPTM